MIAKTKNHGRMRFALWAVVLLTMLSASFAPFQTVKASTSYGYHWTLEFDFDSSYNGILTVEAGPGTVNNLAKVYVTKETRVTCNPVGAMALAGSNAEFNGGYLNCDLNLARAIDNAMEACADVDPECRYNVPAVERYQALTMYAKVPATVPGTAPIFHHPDASFTLQAGTGTATMDNKINPVPGVISSTVFGLGNPLIGARYICAAGPVCDMQYWGGGSALPSVGPFANLLQMQTGSVSFYIGHNPDTGATTPAGTAYDRIFIDPSAGGEH